MWRMGVCSHLAKFVAYNNEINKVVFSTLFFFAFSENVKKLKTKINFLDNWYIW